MSNTEFPTLVYICPGIHHRDGGTYDYRSVKNQEQLDDLLSKGYRLTLGEAINPEVKEEVPDEQESHDFTPPTREELEQKADELGIEYRSNIGDEKLEKRIEEALAEKAKENVVD